MEFTEVLKNRRSIRKFKSEKISHDVLKEIAENAGYAPSWKNSQTARYFFIDNDDVKNQIAENCTMGFEHNRDIIKNAPVLAVLAIASGRSGFERDGSFTTSKGDRWEMFDSGIAAQTLCLSAYEKGIGTCIMGIFDDKKVAETIKLPENLKAGALIVMGIPDENPSAPKRKSTDETVAFI